MRVGPGLRALRSSLKGQSLPFVPKHEALSQEAVSDLQNFVDAHSSLFVITGAGISTESGIPDYRSEGVGLYARTNHRPIKIQDFLASAQTRKRYWARNFIGWPGFSRSEPNPAHHVLRQWEVGGKVGTLLTQNVDGLHRKAGSLEAVELHGTGWTVICLACAHRLDRELFQGILQEANPHFSPGNRISEVRPDGDIQLEEEEVERFVLPSCPSCGTGILQPEIVFFGANVKREKVEDIYGSLRNCDSVLVLGSSLQVFSSLRFVLRAHENRVPIGIVTLGPTRADHFAKLKITARLGDILPRIRV